MTKALVIVAHPDDETIWMGGKIIHEKDWQWTVLSLCRKDDPDRKPKFFKVCSELNARAFISDLEDDHPEQLLPTLDEVIKRIEPITHDKEFDYVFTHSQNGEYGHNRHKETSSAVLQMINTRAIVCKNLFVFDYVRKENPFRAEPNSKPEVKFTLSMDEFKKKKYLIHNVYGFEENGFEFRSCSAIETFRKVR